MDNPFQSPVILSLCTGMRGLERGLERAIGSITVAAYVEIEAFIIYNLVRQMEQGVVDAAPVWTDIKTFPSAAFHRKIHWIIGGYPCQPFSVAGLQKGTEDPRHLWPYIKESIRIIQPFGCFFENVSNHLNIGYREVRQDLEELGYSVKEGIYTAEEVGAPHERKRLFILALADTYSDGWKKHRSTTTTRKNDTPGWKKCIEELWTVRAGTEITGLSKDQTGAEQLADTNSSGGGQNWQPGELWAEGIEQPPGNSGESNQGPTEKKPIARWPTGPWVDPYDWEEQRTVEPGLGCTVNGYNFRTDLLRMYGNGVVEQTAEIAFKDLMRKHLTTVD